MVKEMSKNLDMAGAIIALVLGILLAVGVVSLELVVGIILIIVGVLALSRRL